MDQEQYLLQERVYCRVCGCRIGDARLLSGKATCSDEVCFPELKGWWKAFQRMPEDGPEMSPWSYKHRTVPPGLQRPIRDPDKCLRKKPYLARESDL